MVRHSGKQRCRNTERRKIKGWNRKSQKEKNRNRQKSVERTRKGDSAPRWKMCQNRFSSYYSICCYPHSCFMLTRLQQTQAHAHLTHPPRTPVLHTHWQVPLAVFVTDMFQFHSCLRCFDLKWTVCWRSSVIGCCAGILNRTLKDYGFESRKKL